jgi:LacI family transcriptional regulator
VLAAVKALRYQPDPHMARMMTLVRSRKTARQRAVLAVVREAQQQDELHDAAYQYVHPEDIARRAAQHGYQIEEFHLSREGMTPRRLSQILKTRGIEGMIVSPQCSQMLCAELEYADFSAATFGYGLQRPSLHRAAGNMTLGIRRAATTLAARGYRRIGLAVTRWVDERSDHTYSAAMLHFQASLPSSDQVPLLLLPHNSLEKCAGAFASWMKAHRPDALISFDTHIPEWLRNLGLRIPEDIGLVVHDWTKSMQGFAGIHQRREHVAAVAVDLVATQLFQNERGIPEVPRQILIPPAWIEGASIRPAG